MSKITSEDKIIIQQIVESTLELHGLIKPTKTLGENKSNRFNLYDWVYVSNDEESIVLGVIIAIIGKKEYLINTQDGNECWFMRNQLKKSSQEQIDNYLISLAITKFPTGTKLKNNGLSMSSIKSNGIVRGNYFTYHDELWVDATDSYKLKLWDKKQGWAEAEPECVKPQLSISEHLNQWYWNADNKRFLGTIKELNPNASHEVVLDNQDGKVQSCVEFRRCLKATDEEISKYLKNLAFKKGFKAKTTILSPDNQKYVISDIFVFFNGKLYAEVFESDFDVVKIWENGKWAQIIDTNWKPVFGQPYWYINPTFQPNQSTWVDSDYDKGLFNAKNCFQTKELAQSIINEIKLKIN